MRSDYLSRDWRNDDPRHFAFVRNTRIPHGTFRKQRSEDWYVMAATIVLAVVLAALLLGGWL